MLLDLLIRRFQVSVFNAYQHILLLIRIHSCFNLDNLIIQEMSDFQGCQCGKCTMSIFDVAIHHEQKSSGFLRGAETHACKMQFIHIT